MSARAPQGFPGSSRGFTLVEVVIVVAIIGILMAIVLPGYQDSLQKGRRADAKAGLMDAANRQERFMLDRSSYTADMTQLGFAADPAISAETHYAIDVAADPNCPIASCYILTATPVVGGAQADDSRCTKFILDSNGARDAEGSAAAECW
ncbi:MAG: type IV pilin protein [Pseudomonadales bacterium]|nr:type IV pilin protein [Halioglobus sp.]MCP5130039.1 type IV pilin protein [Pseudomonadales bacterium]